MKLPIYLIASLLLTSGVAQTNIRVTDDPQFSADVEQAEALIKGRDYKAAIAHLFNMTADYEESPEVSQLLGQALHKNGLSDLACEHYETAYARFTALENEREAKACRTAIMRIDKGVAKARFDFFETATEDLLRASSKLRKSGDTKRALEVIIGLEQWATNKEKTELLAAIEELRAEVSKLDLEQGQNEREEDFDPTHWEKYQSKRYKLRGQIEPGILIRIGTMMDLVHEYYALTFFPGKKAPSEKATIQIFSTHEDMASVWNTDMGPPPAGWWSPASRLVFCYDTRTDNNGRGNLDQLLRTLFHEASHQFTTYLASKGSQIPSWINEGTACYFEGIVVLGDQSVIPPEAAVRRLTSLLYRFPQKPGSTLSLDTPSLIRRAVTFTKSEIEPKFPGELYCVAWGLAYFLRSYEDPETGDYGYRPLYNRYLEEIQTTEKSPLELFEELFIGANSPAPFEQLEDFETFWRGWIIERSSMFIGTTKNRTIARENHLADLNRWFGVANSKEEIQDLRLRLISDYAYIRNNLEEAQAPSIQRYRAEIDLHEQEIQKGVRFNNHKAIAAALVENLLRYAELNEDVHNELTNKLKELNQGNSAASKRDELLVKTEKRAIEICRKYQDREKPHTPRRGLSFVKEASCFLSQGVLDPWQVSFEKACAKTSATEFGQRVNLNEDWSQVALRMKQAQSSGRLSPKRSADTGVDLEMAIKAEDEVLMRSQATATDQSLRIQGELTLERSPNLGNGAGLVLLFPDDLHLVFFFNEERQLSIKELNCSSSPSSWNLPILATEHLTPPISPDEVIKLRVTLLNEGYIILQVGDRAPIQVELPSCDFEEVGVGVYSKGTSVQLRGLQFTRWQTSLSHLVNEL